MFFLHENKTPEPPKTRINYTKETNNWTLMLVGKFEKTDIKHKKALLDLQFLKFVKTIMPFQSFYALKLLILIWAHLPHTDDVKVSFYGKRFTTKDLLLVNLTKNLNRYIIMLILI